VAEPGLLRRIYNPRERVTARSEGPNPSGPAIMLPCLSYEEKNPCRKDKIRRCARGASQDKTHTHEEHKDYWETPERPVFSSEISALNRRALPRTRFLTVELNRFAWSSLRLKR
jgi:hypothetical protein